MCFKIADAEIRQLMMNIHERMRKIFLKLCYFSIVLLLAACKSDTATKQTSDEEKASKTEDNTAVVNPAKTIVFFGDSLTAGYGLDDEEDAFPGHIQKTIDSLGLDYTVINSGVSGETTSGGKNRINWVLNQKPDIFVLELGANDGLRGVLLSETKENLQAIIDAVQQKYPDTKIVLVGMQIPPNMGPEYTAEFKGIFPYLARKNNLPLVPFLLENVGGIPELNQSDGIHPTKEGHQILANNVWQVLAPILQ